MLAGFPLQHHLVITNKIIPKRLYLEIGKLIQKKVRSKPWYPAVECLTRSHHARGEQEDRSFNIPPEKEPKSPSFSAEMESQNVKDDLKDYPVLALTAMAGYTFARPVCSRPYTVWP